MKIKLNFDIDELYPWYSFSEASSESSNFIEVDEKEYKDFLKKSRAFWKAYYKIEERAKQEKNNEKS